MSAFVTSFPKYRLGYALPPPLVSVVCTHQTSFSHTSCETTHPTDSLSVNEDGEKEMRGELWIDLACQYQKAKGQNKMLLTYIHIYIIHVNICNPLHTHACTHTHNDVHQNKVIGRGQTAGLVY